MPDAKAPGVFVKEVTSSIFPIQGAGTSTAGFIGVYDSSAFASALNTSTLATEAQVVLCTNFTEFINRFGGFIGAIPPPAAAGAKATTSAAPNTPAIKAPTDSEKHSYLVHAVYGFFNNGGTRCFVTRVKDASAVSKAIDAFEAIDEISIVVAPGITDPVIVDSIVTHCARQQDRIAVLDAPEVGADNAAPDFSQGMKASMFAACYHPWIEVFDPELIIDKATSKKGANRYVPPSGHVAGIYARVDATRGVHKAPANEQVVGALGVRWPISARIQEGILKQNVNCIRAVNGSIRVWGARTLAGSDQPAFTYVNVRRVFSFLFDSLRAGLQWTVFEPNNADLWARIVRNTTSFLTTVWASGALFGSKPEEAFYVKCDAENNPPEQRELGQVTTEIGVAIVRPAEFVVIRLGQWVGPSK